MLALALSHSSPDGQPCSSPASTVAGKVSGRGGLVAAPSFEVIWASVAMLQNKTAMRTLTVVQRFSSRLKVELILEFGVQSS